MNRTWNTTSGPIKAIRDPAIASEDNTQTSKDAPKIQIIKKKLLNLPRSDSVRSNVSAYPILQNGPSKVVKLIRYESGQQVSDT